MNKINQLSSLKKTNAVQNISKGSLVVLLV
jgi:hypothetical protein